MKDLKEKVYPSGDKQYFNKEGNLVKTVLKCGIVIDFTGRNKKVYMEPKS